MTLKLSDRETDAFIGKMDFEKGKGLIPVIIQDMSDNKVLMHAYMNEEALRLTLTKGRMHYWSRSRGKIWLKGEESGHYSLPDNVILDCDNDAILFKVQQVGAVCHTGQDTCFHKPLAIEERSRIDAKILERIFEIVSDRIQNPTKESYVSKLTDEGEDATLKKIGEEAVELILAAKGNRSEEIIHEATDVFFHILVLLAQKGINLQEIFKELDQRHQTKTRTPKC